MDDLRKIVSGIVLASFLSFIPYSNLQAQEKRKYTLEQECEMTKAGLFFILKGMKKYGRKEFSTPEINISEYSKERLEIEYKCAGEYVENETGGAYGVSKEEKDGKMKFVVFKKGNLT